MTARKILSGLVSILPVVLVVSCGGSANRPFTLEPTPVLSVSIGYVVVQDAWVRLKAEPQKSAKDAGFVRRGDLFEVESRSRVEGAQDRGVWYLVSSDGASGWLHEKSILYYKTEKQAKRSLKDMD